MLRFVAHPLRITAFVVLVLTIGLAGCGGPKTGTVNGKITVKGKAPGVDGLQITFMGTDGRVALTTINSDGSYNASAVPAGVVKIGIITPQADRPAPPASAKPTDGPPDAKALAQWEKDVKEWEASSSKSALIPGKLRDPLGSGLVVTVESGQAAVFNYDIK